MNGLTVFYMHPNESYQREEHSYPLVPGLTPIIYVKNEELKFLGKPYTECNENSTYWISTCQLEELIERIQSFCDCTPSYMVARKDSYFVQGRDFLTMRGSGPVVRKFLHKTVPNVHSIIIPLALHFCETITKKLMEGASYHANQLQFIKRPCM